MKKNNKPCKKLLPVIQEIIDLERADAVNKERRYIFSVWTRLMHETDDPIKKEVYANCIKALNL